MIFCVGVEPHASYSCLQNNCNMMNNKLNCETIFATLYFLHPFKCLQALLMVPYLDSVYIFIAQNLTQAYTIQDMQDKCFFVCHLCCSRHLGFPFVHLRIFCSLFESEKLDHCFLCTLVVTFLQPKRTTYLHTYERKSV